MVMIMPTSQVVVGLISTEGCKVPGTSRCSIKGSYYTIILFLGGFFYTKIRISLGPNSPHDWLPLGPPVTNFSQNFVHSTQMSSKFVTQRILWSKKKARGEIFEDGMSGARIPGSPGDGE